MYIEPGDRRGPVIKTFSLAEQYVYWILSKYWQQVRGGEGSDCHLTTTPDRDIQTPVYNHWYPSLSPVTRLGNSLNNI